MNELKKMPFFFASKEDSNLLNYTGCIPGDRNKWKSQIKYVNELQGESSNTQSRARAHTLKHKHYTDSFEGQPTSPSLNTSLGCSK
jgi:hypothetical protein